MKTIKYSDYVSDFSLNRGQTALIGLTNTRTENKVQLMFIEQIKRPSARGRLLAKANKSDERFNANNYQPAWLTVTIPDIVDLFDNPEIGALVHKKAVALKESDIMLSKGEFVPFANAIINPKLEGDRMRLVITESHVAKGDDVQYLNERAKQDGNGNYLLSNGKLIFSDTTVDLVGEGEEVPHQFIKHDSTTTDPYDADFDIQMDREEEEILDAQESEEEIA